MISIEKLDIIHYPHPALRWKAKPLTITEKGFIQPKLVQEVVARMFELMYDYRGIGLAATQIGLPWQIFVTDLDNDDTNKSDQSKQKTFINPVLSTNRYKRQASDLEGCLSLPGVTGEVIRVSRDVKVEAYDQNAEFFVLGGLAGRFARVIWHEFDHLQGILFIDHLHLQEKEQQEHLEACLTYLKVQYDWEQNTTKTLPQDSMLLEQLVQLEQFINEKPNEI